MIAGIRRHPRATIVKRAILTACLLITIGLVLPTHETDASSGHCNGSCLSIAGTRLHVLYVTPGVEVPPYTEYYGHMETWGPGFHFSSYDQWYNNVPSMLFSGFDGPKYYINQTFPNNTQICTRFWRKNGLLGNGQGYFSLPIQCLTVHN